MKKRIIKKRTYKDGTTYEGEFLNTKKHGQGKITLENGTTYEGVWIYGKLHGQCKVTLANGKEYFKEYQNGEFVKLLD